MKTRLTDQGGTVFSTSPIEFGKFIADDTAKWAEVIRTANIKLE
jgi:tripartite-type tricarboxylate transporter receptor subunit TctC